MEHNAGELERQDEATTSLSRPLRRGNLRRSRDCHTARLGKNALADQISEEFPCGLGWRDVGVWCLCWRPGIFERRNLDPTIWTAKRVGGIGTSIDERCRGK